MATLRTIKSFHGIKAKTKQDNGKHLPWQVSYQGKKKIITSRHPLMSLNTGDYLEAFSACASLLFWGVLFIPPPPPPTRYPHPFPFKSSTSRLRSDHHLWQLEFQVGVMSCMWATVCCLEQKQKRKKQARAGREKKGNVRIGSGERRGSLPTLHGLSRCGFIRISRGCLRWGRPHASKGSCGATWTLPTQTGTILQESLRWIVKRIVSSLK